MMSDDESEQTTSEPTSWMVDVYLVDKTYGGPEEGGWWYDSGELCRDPDVLKELMSHNLQPNVWLLKYLADGICRRMQKVLDETVNVGRRPINSMVSIGRYQAIVHPELSPRSFPAQRPRYE